MIQSDDSFRYAGLWPERFRKRALARFFFCHKEGKTNVSSIQAEIEARLAEAEPDVEVLLAEVAPGGLRPRLHRPSRTASRSRSASASPTRWPRSASATRSRSPRPGLERPLTKPAHFRRFLGRKARVRTRGEHDGRRSFTGELVGANDDAVTIAVDSGVVAIPYADINRSNLVEE